jgi:hypothetical protein
VPLKGNNLKNILIILTFILTNISLCAQIFTGKSIDKSKNYNCALKINSDSSIIFICNTEENELYGQYEGTIKRVNDSVFSISATMTLGKTYAENFYKANTTTHVINDTDYVFIDTTYKEMLKFVKIKYANNQEIEYKWNTENSMFLAKRQFNKSDKKNYYYIQTEANDKINGKKLSFIVRFGTIAAFEKGQKLEINVIIKGNYLFSIDAFNETMGEFKMTKRGT